jgi:hypothetical protein
MPHEIELHVPMQIRAVAGVGLSETELERRAKSAAFDPASFEEHELFFFDTEISNRNLDFYLTRMDDGSLRNYVADAEAGVSFQDSHEIARATVGRSLAGRYHEDSETDKYGVTINRAYATFYTAAGIKIGETSTDEFINGVRTGLIHDVSIGFYASEYRCSICAAPMYDGWFGVESDCYHIPGLTYAIADENGDPIIDVVNGQPMKRLAWVDVIDGHLTEVSYVYKGATPEAAILKADFLAKSGRIAKTDARRFEAKYRHALPDKIETFLAATAPLDQGVTEMAVRKSRAVREAEREASVGITPAEETPTEATPEEELTLDPVAVAEPVEEPDDETVITDDEETEEAPEEETSVTEDETPVDPATEAPEEERAFDPFNSIRDEMKSRGIALGTDPVKAVRALVGALDKSRADAKVGRQYRRDMIEEALNAGVRSMQPGKFNKDRYRSILESLPGIDDIKQMRDDWIATGDERLRGNTDHTGGRLTVLEGGAGEDSN